MFRPNLQNEDHRQAWALLQAVPEGQKSAFLVKAILNSARQDTLESTLRRILREELQTVPSQPVQQPEEAIPPEMLGFCVRLKRYGIRKKVYRDSIWCRVLLPEKSPRNWRIKSEWNLRIGCSAENFRRWSVPISTPNASTTILCGTLFPWKTGKSTAAI